ncbi:MAG: hypothetical protein ACE14L_01060 [Terriglobales bacterium]
MDAALERNAFRVLSLPADAQERAIYRQQQRIQNALELGDAEADPRFAFLPRLPISPEVLLEAVHRIEKQRAIEELFWVHELDGKFDFTSAAAESVLAALRKDAVQNTTKGAVAQHNLAVILTCMAQGLNGSRRLDYWKDAIQHWAATLANDVFWQFMLDRAEGLNGNGEMSAALGLRTVAREAIQGSVLREVWSAVESRDYNAVSFLSAAIRENADLLDADATLAAIATRMAKDASVAIGGVLDRLSLLEKDANKTIARNSLVSAEKDLKKVGDDFDVVIRSFGDTTCFDGVYDARAVALKQLSVAYFNIVNDEPEALRLVMEARSLARDPKLISEIDAGWKHIRRSLICSEALAFVESKNYTAAEEKLAIALTLSTEEQKPEIQEMQEGVHRARVFRDVDPNRRSPSLYTFNGIGVRFYGRRDFDTKTKTYITVHWFVVLFLPILPLACYRVSDSGPNLWTIYGRVPLTPFLRKYRWGVLAIIAILVIAAMISGNDSSLTGSSTYTPASPPAQTSYSSPFADSRTSEKDAIEAEREELKHLSDSLDSQKAKLEDDSAELERMQSYISSVKDTYTEETVPEDIRAQYNATVDDYNRKLPAYNAAVRSYNRDLQQYKERVAAFNQRVDRYNANR